MKTRLNEHQIDISHITLSPEQKELYRLIENSADHFYITGKAGTGKSVLLQYFKANSKKNLVVVAPTGVAALNVGGQTIHSLFKIPPEFIQRDSLRQVDNRTQELLRSIDTVVIDEVSMVRADLMDAIDYRLRQARESIVPFGGVQMIMFGDLYQLPPVVSDPDLYHFFFENFGGHYFFNAYAWKTASFEIIELNHIFRQSDETFKAILDAVRTNNMSSEHLSWLNTRSGLPIPEDGVLTLATTNRAVNQINDSHLARLKSELFEYRASISGDLEPSAFPTEEILRLRKGAQVMMVKNDRDKQWVNGSVGVVESLSSSEIKVRIDGIVYEVPQETWNKIRYYYDRENNKIEEEVVSSFAQFPLRLAWAITIHKSQGQTYGTVAVDMGGGAFAHGQTYVALSRCKSLEGLYLKRQIGRQDVIVDPQIVTFMSRALVVQT